MATIQDSVVKVYNMKNPVCPIKLDEIDLKISLQNVQFNKNADYIYANSINGV